jgi:hypothetical protein
MVNRSGKPPPKRPGATGSGQKDAGHLGVDDRGNVTWQWANDDELQADDTLGAAQRLRALVDPTLDIVDDDSPNAVQHNPHGLVKGYDPYSSGTLGKQSRKKKKDLRELSKWLELKKRMEEKKNEDGK